MSRLRLGEIMIQEGHIDEAQLQSALGHQRRWGKKLGECLVQLGFVPEVELARTLAKAMRLPVIDLSKIDSAKITKEILSYVSLNISRAQRIVPLAIKEIKGRRRLVLATSDP